MAGVRNIVELSNMAAGRIVAEAAHMVVVVNMVNMAGIVSTRMVKIDTAAQAVARSCLLPSLEKSKFPYESSIRCFPIILYHFCTTATISNVIGLRKSHIAQLRLAAYGGKRGRERAWRGGPRHALSLLSG